MEYILAAFDWLTSLIAWEWLAGGAAAIYFSLRTFIRWKRKQIRLKELTERFGPDDAQRIMDQYVWIGMSQEALLESRGAPEAKDQRAMKSRFREVWKWGQTGAGRYAYRVTVDDGFVSAFDFKD